MSILRIIETNPLRHSLCLFWSDWRKVCATSAAAGGGAPGPVPQERGTGRGRLPPNPAAPEVTPPQADETRTQEQIQGMSFQLSQLRLVSLTA